MGHSPPLRAPRRHTLAVVIWRRTLLVNKCNSSQFTKRLLPTQGVLYGTLFNLISSHCRVPRILRDRCPLLPEIHLVYFDGYLRLTLGQHVLVPTGQGDRPSVKYRYDQGRIEGQHRTCKDRSGCFNTASTDFKRSTEYPLMAISTCAPGSSRPFGRPQTAQVEASVARVLLASMDQLAQFSSCVHNRGGPGSGVRSGNRISGMVQAPCLA